MIYYCDSSALVKIYLDETGSSYMKTLSRKTPRADIFINDIAGPEVLSALHRRFRSGDLPNETFSRARSDFGEDYRKFFSRISALDSIIYLAMRIIDKHSLRGYDSVQLATALHLQQILRAFNGREVFFVGSDKALNAAAAQEGLNVINPAESA